MKKTRQWLLREHWKIIQNVDKHIKLHRHKEKVFSVRTSLYCGEILDRLPKLLEKSKVDLGYGFWIELGVSSENYVFVARENTSREDPHCMFDVFALKVQDGGKMRLDEVFNTARSTFACAFGSEEKGNLTVYYYPNSRSADDDQGKLACMLCYVCLCTI